jgi:exodeoxyribonuclease-3
MRIATHNVNGIRAAQRRGFETWRDERMADVIGLQEVRCPADQLPLEVFGGYHVTYDPGTLAGRNGVALLTREPVAAVRSWGTQVLSWAPGTVPVLADVEDDCVLARELRAFVAEGRYLEVDLAGAPVTIASVYVPKGDSPVARAIGRAARLPRSLSTQDGFPRRFSRGSCAGRGWAAAGRGREYVCAGRFQHRHTGGTCATGAATRPRPGSCRKNVNGSVRSCRRAPWWM